MTETTTSQAAVWSTVQTYLNTSFDAGQWTVWVGYVLLLLCVWVAIRLFRAYHASVESSPRFTPNEAVQRKQERTIRREAKRWKRAKAYSRAGECYAAIGDIEHAIEMYRKAGAHKTLAQLYRRQKRWGEAAHAYERCGELQQAAGMYHAERDYTKAAHLFARTGQLTMAAEMYERAGQTQNAAEYYEQAGHFERAARLCEEIGNTEKAATLYEEHFLKERDRLRDPTESTSGKSAAEVNGIAKISAQLYLQSNQVEKAASLFEQSGDLPHAAAAFKSAGRYEDAARLYEQEGLDEEAADCFESAGQGERALLIRAQHLVQTGQLEQAADLLERAGEVAQAADLFEQAGHLSDAAQRYLDIQDYPRAAELFLKTGDRRQAAMAWEAGQRWKDAAQLYGQIGEVDKARGLYEKLGDFYEAAVLCRTLGHQGRTIELLQKVDTQSDDYYNASLLLGELFVSQEMWDAARERYLKLISEISEPGWRLEPLYRLATIAEKQRDYASALTWHEKILSHDVNYRDVMGRANLLKRALASAKRAMTDATKDSSTVVDQENHKPRRYRIVTKIGQGGMGIVYKAEDPVLNRTVAYKVLPPSVKEQPKILASFLREARISASLNHPNIVAVYDAGHEGTDLYIVMEYIDGISLKERLQQVAPLPHDEFLHIAIQLCDGLAYAHRRKIVHRDIKPANIMLSREGQVKIMDFGLAKVVSDALADKTSVKGTPLYMAPEQVTGEHVDHQSDIYSLGCTLYRMATGRPPFTSGDLYYHHLHTQPEPPVSLNPQISQPLNRLLLTCLAKKKSERFSDMKLIVRALQAIPVQSGLSVSS